MLFPLREQIERITQADGHIYEENLCAYLLIQSLSGV